MKKLVTMRAIRAVWDAIRDRDLVETRVLDEIRGLALNEPKRRKKRAPLGSPRRVRHAELLATGAIWSACAQRAGGKCEACGAAPTVFAPLEMDHFFGRGKGRPLQSVANCWLLCRPCHRMKTDNRPGGRHWFERFEKHAQLHGYQREAQEARKHLEGRLALRNPA